MSAFLSPLHVAQITDERWQLITDLIYESDRLQRTVTVPSGFETDFASVPRLPFIFWLAGGKATKAAVVHDFLYRQSGVSRADADAVFAEAMKASGQAGWRGSLMWAGVRVGGWSAYKPATLDQTDELKDKHETPPTPPDLPGG